MPTIPFNEHTLWRGQLQKSRPLYSQEKCLSIELAVEYEDLDKERYDRDLNYRYKVYSQSYWVGVKQRMLEYRKRNYIPLQSSNKFQ